MRYRDVYPKWRIQENPSPAHAKKRIRVNLINCSITSQKNDCVFACHIYNSK
jgi:hypothetical protein